MQQEKVTYGAVILSNQKFDCSQEGVSFQTRIVTPLFWIAAVKDCIVSDASIILQQSRLAADRNRSQGPQGLVLWIAGPA